MKRSPAERKAWEAQLTQVTLVEFFKDVKLSSRHRTRLVAQLRQVYAESDERAQGVLDQLRRGNGKRISNLLRSTLGVAGLRAWAQANHPDLTQRLSSSELDRHIASFVTRNDPQSTRVLEAAIRHQVQRQDSPDDALIRETFGKHLTTVKEAIMASSAPPTTGSSATTVVPDYHVDVNAVPGSSIPDTPHGYKGYDDAYQGEVGKLIKAQTGVDKTGSEHIYAALMGSLLLDGYYDWTAQGFNDNIASAWLQIQKAISDPTGQIIMIPDPGDPNKSIPLTGPALYLQLQQAVVDIRGTTTDPKGNTVGPWTFVQEFAQAGRQLIESGKAALVNEPHAYFVSAVRLALDSYVSGTAAGGSLDLPPLSDTDGGDSEIVADNIFAFSMIYAAYQLEQVKLIQVVERTVEVWSNGQLPIGYGPAGKALDRWYWDSFERMTDSGRMMQFARVLGAKGGEVSKEVQPNNNFNDLLLRFLSSLAEYDRQTRIADIVGSTRAGNVSDAQVRKAGRDLAANMTLYCWGGGPFVARRLNADIGTAISILQIAEIQKAWGVQSAWQTVERVCTQEFNFTPNVVKYRTMAESGKTILDIVGKYYNVWGSTTNAPLFCPPNGSSGTSAFGGNWCGADISPDDQRTLMRHTEYWLAVNGIQDQQVQQNAEPSDTAFSPSIPTLEPVSTNGSGGGALADQLRQMVQQGQTPTLEQIQKLLPVAKVGV